jgi:hypothetical protein
MANATKGFRDYREDPGYPPLIIYTEQHRRMTVDGVKNLLGRYEAAFTSGYEIKPGTLYRDIDQKKLASHGAVIPMNMWQIFNILRYNFDATDPDAYETAQDLHCIQVGIAGGEPKTPKGRMLRLFGFIHDISKAIFGIDMADQLVVGGDIYPLGVCPIQVIGREGKDMVPYPNHGFTENADYKNGIYPKDPQHPDYRYGIYSEFVRSGTMSLDKLVMLFQHDRHLRIILDHMSANDHQVPEDWMKTFKFLAAYHSFHALHDFDDLEGVRNGPYYWTTSAEEKAMLESGIPEDHKRRDLYTKTDLKVNGIVVDEETYRRTFYPIVEKMLGEYFPKPILVPVLTDRLPRFLRLMETTDLIEILDLISPAVLFNPEGGVILRPSETRKPFKGELINGFLELLRVRAVEENNQDLLRITQEIASALPRIGQFYGMGKPIEDVLDGFNSDASPRSPELMLAINRIVSKPLIGVRANAELKAA